MDREKARAKVAKLMAMGHSPTANENEAEAALRQAAALMKAHAIEQAELTDATGQKQAFDWTAVCVPLDPRRRSANAVGWIGSLAVHIARFTETRASYKRVEPHGMVVEIKGDATDVEYGVYLMKHLRDTIRGWSAKYPGGRRDREDYRRGMVERLGERMTALRAQMRSDLEASPTSGGGSALMVIDCKRDALTVEYGPERIKKSAVRASDPGSRVAGRAAGERVGFGRPVGGPSQRALT